MSSRLDRALATTGTVLQLVAQAAAVVAAVRALRGTDPRRGCR